MRKSHINEVSVTGSRRARSTGYWWIMAQGLCALIFGILAIFWPKLTLSLFLYVFGIYAIVDGLSPLGHAISGGRVAQTRGRRILFIEGIISVIAGVLCLVLPRAHERLLLYIVAAWLLLKGASFIMQRRVRGWQTALVGVLAILVGLFIFFAATISVHLILLMVGIFALIMGVVLFRRGWRARATRRAELSAAG